MGGELGLGHPEKLRTLGLGCHGSGRCGCANCVLGLGTLEVRAGWNAVRAGIGSFPPGEKLSVWRICDELKRFVSLIDLSRDVEVAVEARRSSTQAELIQQDESDERTRRDKNPRWHLRR